MQNHAKCVELYHSVVPLQAELEESSVKLEYQSSDSQE